MYGWVESAQIERKNYHEKKLMNKQTGKQSNNNELKKTTDNNKKSVTETESRRQVTIRFSYCVILRFYVFIFWIRSLFSGS